MHMLRSSKMYYTAKKNSHDTNDRFVTFMSAAPRPICPYPAGRVVVLSSTHPFLPDMT